MQLLKHSNIEPNLNIINIFGSIKITKLNKYLGFSQDELKCISKNHVTTALTRKVKPSLGSKACVYSSSSLSAETEPMLENE